MSSDAFDHLRRKHPEMAQRLVELERYIKGLVRESPDAIIDEFIVAQELDIAEPAIQRLLVELVGAHQLDTVFLWLCPMGRGTAREELKLASFPERLECSRCGDEHWFHQNNIQVRFIASDELKREVGRVP